MKIETTLIPGKYYLIRSNEDEALKKGRFVRKNDLGIPHFISEEGAEFFSGGLVVEDIKKNRDTLEGKNYKEQWKEISGKELED